MNTSEMHHREIKAAKLAAVLYKIGATVEDVVNASAEDWAKCAAAAGCKPPNPANPKPTVDAVLAALTRMHLDGTAEPKSAQQEADEAERADAKDTAKWEESQEYGGNRCPERE